MESGNVQTFQLRTIDRIDHVIEIRIIVPFRVESRNSQAHETVKSVQHAEETHHSLKSSIIWKAHRNFRHRRPWKH